MKIVYRQKFVTEFSHIWDYIAVDSKSRANTFKHELKVLIENISFMPYKCRKSIYFDDENIRDLIFKGYVIPYKIDEINKQIIIVGVNKYRGSL